MSIMTAIKSGLSNTGFQLRKAAPTIGVTVGVVGIAGTAILASRATLKAGDILKEHKTLIDQIDETYGLHKDGVEVAKDYDEKAYAAEHAGIWVETGLKYAKLYAPAIAVGVASATLIICSHKTMSNRLAAASSAISVLQMAFDNYRQNVIDEIGEEKEAEIVKKGREKKKQEYDEAQQPTPGQHHMHRMFDEGQSIYWSRNPHDNIALLKRTQEYMNDQLCANGYVFLNDVYEALGFDRVPMGQRLGWMYDNHGKMGYIDLGVFDDVYDVNVAMNNVDTYDNRYLLEFNVQGDIWDRI